MIKIGGFLEAGASGVSKLLKTRTGKLLGRLLLPRQTFSIALIIVLLAIFYWGFFASDRYVSEAHIVIHRTDLASSPAGSSSSMVEQMLLRDYLLSVDML